MKEDQENWDEEYKQESNKFKWYRKFFFVFGKTMKYIMWASFAMYGYHLYLVNYKDKPSEHAWDQRFLDAAIFTKVFYKDMKELMTMPPVNCLLGDRGPIPPGYQVPKTLVLNVNGTLVHSEYKVSLLIASLICCFSVVWNWF